MLRWASCAGYSEYSEYSEQFHQRKNATKSPPNRRNLMDEVLLWITIIRDSAETKRCFCTWPLEMFHLSVSGYRRVQWEWTMWNQFQQPVFLFCNIWYKERSKSLSFKTMSGVSKSQRRSLMNNKENCSGLIRGVVFCEGITWLQYPIKTPSVNSILTHNSK